MDKIDALIEQLADIKGSDFRLLTAGAEVTGLKINCIVINATTVFAKLTTTSGANALTGKGIGSTEIAANQILPFYKDNLTNVQITSGSVIGYYK